MRIKLIAILLILGLVLGTYSISNYAIAASENLGKIVPNGKNLPPTSPPGLEKTGMTRVISSATSEQEISDIQQKGCTVIHKLNQATSFFCPSEIVETLDNVRPVKIYYPHDLEADTQIQADRVWNELGFDGSGVTVAILDTGVQTTHAEVTNSVYATRDFTGEGGDYLDYSGHGTHVSGIVTGDGIYSLQGTSNKAAGVAPGASIIVGKVCGFSGCPEDAIIAGITWAKNQGAAVINMSLGGGASGAENCDNDGVLMVNAVNDAAADGVVVVVSSGNDSNKNAVSYPACASGAIAVGAVNSSDQVANFSNAGPALDIVAPGVSVLSSWSCNDISSSLSCSSTWYYYASGTSMSSPHIAGVVALLLEKDPTLTVDQIKNALYSTAVQVGSFDGNGRVDAFAAVNFVSSTTPNLPPTSNVGGPYTGTEGSVMSFSGSASDDSDGTIVDYDWSFGDGSTGTGISPSHTYAIDGAYTVSLIVTDNDGATDNSSTSATVNEQTAIEVTITDPKDKSDIGGKVTITADVTGGQGSTTVSFFIDGNLIGVDDTSPYQMQFHSKNYSGDLILMASVTADNGSDDSDPVTVTIPPKGGGGGDKKCNPKKPSCNP